MEKSEKRLSKKRLQNKDLFDSSPSGFEQLCFFLFQVTLDAIFEDAIAQGYVVTPDKAMTECEARLRQVFGQPVDTKNNNPSQTFNQYLRKVESARLKAHHYAVDKYYRTYRNVRPGAPSISDEIKQEMFQLRDRGLSHAKIAMKLGLPFNTPEEQRKSKDIVRKRLKPAKKKSDST